MIIFQKEYVEGIPCPEQKNVVHISYEKFSDKLCLVDHIDSDGMGGYTANASPSGMLGGPLLYQG